MEFSNEERAMIDKELETVRQEQRQNGNKLYSFEEVSKKILDRIKKEEKSYRLQDSYNR